MDNGSADGSVEEIAREHPEVQVLPLPENLGAEARNRGLARARGRYVLMLDSDSHPEAGAVDRMVRHFEEEPSLGAAAFRTVLTTESGKDETGGSHNVFIGCGCGFRRDALAEAGGYPGGYGFYVEEYDVSYRLIALGYEVRYFEDLVVYHRKSETGRDFGKVMEHLVRNNLYLYHKYFPFREAARTLGWQLYRYWKIARSRRVLPSYLRGISAGTLRALKGLCQARRLPETALEQVVPDRFCARRLSQIAFAHGLNRVALWGVGKDFAPLIRAAERLGLEIVGAFPGGAGKSFGRQDRVWGVPLLGEGELGRSDIDALIIGSASPGETKNALDYLAGRTNGTPVLPLFTYQSGPLT